MTSPEAPSTSPSVWQRWRRPVLIVGGVAALWTGVVGAWLPGWVKPRAEQAASQALGTPVRIGQIHVQPWTLVVAVDGLSVGPQATPLFQLAHAEVQASIESVWRMAPVLRHVTLVKPELWIERQSATRFNFSSVLAHLQAQPASPKTDDEPARFAVFNIALQDGVVRYTDRVLGQEHRIEQLKVGVPFVSSLPSFVAVEVQPLLSARVDGSPLEIKGQTLPFANGLRSEVKLNWDAIDVPHWLSAAQPFMPPELQVLASSGRLDTALTVQFEERKPPAVPRLAIGGQLKLSQLAMQMPHAPGLGRLQAGWDSLRIEGIDALPLEHQAQIGLVQLDGLSLHNEAPLPASADKSGARSAASAAVPALVAAAKRKAPEQPAKAEAVAAAPWQWRVAKIKLNTQRLDLQPLPSDATAAWPEAQRNGTGNGTAAAPWPAIAMLHLGVQGLDAHPQAKPASWDLTLHDEHGTTLLAQGHVQVAQQLVDAQINLSKLPLQPWLAPFAGVLKLPLQVEQGELAVQAQLMARLKASSALEPAEARLLSGHVVLSQLLAAQAAPAAAGKQGQQRQQSKVSAQAARAAKPADHLKLESLTLDGMQAQLDMGAAPALRTLSVATLDVVQLDAAVTRGPKGEWLGMAPVSADASADSATVATTGTASAGGAPANRAKPLSPTAAPSITLQSLRCQVCQLAFTDQSVSPAAHFALTQTQLQLTDLSSDLGHPFKLDLATLAQGKGRVQLKGEVRPEPLSVSARLNVAGLDLREVQPYIDPLVNIHLAAAKAQADGQLKLQMPAKGGLQAHYKGRVGLSELRVQDRVTDADFLSWQSLSLDGMELSLQDQALDANLGRIALKDFYGRIIINPDGQLNLAGIMRHQAGAEARSLTTPEPASAAASAASAAASGVASGAVTPSSAVAAPSALAASAVPSASASSPATATAAAPAAPPPTLRWQQILLSKGRVDFTDNFIKPNYSARLTQIEGDVSAVASTKPEPATVKISGAVDDAAPLLISGQLHPLGPKLYTDIEGSAKGIELTRLTPYASRYAGYAIEKGTLSVKVHYKVDGGKLEASNQIFLDQLTFGEKTDSPEATKLPVLFAVSLLKNRNGEIDINLPISGSLDDPQFSVGGIIWRVLVNLITKAVMAPFSLLSGGSDELGFVAFDAGSYELNEATRQRLDTLATKLTDRPALKLEATGRADPVADAEGLRRAHVDKLMRAAKAKATDAALDDTRIAPEERATWLLAAYKAADIKKPRNVVGLAKTLPPDEMEALLKAAAPTGPEALRALANQRGDQVKSYLANKMPPERVLLTASKVGAEGLADDKGSPSRVQFAIK
jgi:hypothetical protein